ncbi:hypothetical protein FRC04_007080 [Tulasnella sp. 424]|nr:hypothetical protein FRC04_007080 [Tulasnella sp. 424]KAG8976898.1 hypothetical protein FRC05_002835 [Tulasnella sp. 425]
MAPLADEINAAASNAGLGRRQNDGIGFTNVQVRRNNPTEIKYRWSYHDRSPDRFTVWFRNVKTQEHYKAEPYVQTRGNPNGKTTGLSSLNHKTGKYQLVITQYNNWDNVYARSYTFNIHNSDF